MTFSLPVAVHVFLKKDEQILFMKRIGTGFQDGKWSVPAGRLESGESITDAAIREAKEEVGVNIKKQDLSIPLFMHHQDERGERLYAFFLVTAWTGEPDNLEPDKCGGIGFYPLEKAPEPIVDHVKTALDGLLAEAHYLEYGFKL